MAFYSQDPTEITTNYVYHSKQFQQYLPIIMNKVTNIKSIIFMQKGLPMFAIIIEGFD